MCIQLDAFRTTMNGTVRMFVDWVKIYQQGAVSEINFPYSGNNVNIFPNPVIDYMDVKLSNNADLQSLDIYNIDGIMIKSTQTGLPKIDCSGLKAGLYLLKVNLKLKTEVVKFVKS